MRWKVVWISICLFALCASGQDREIEELEREMEELAEQVEILEGLDAGMEALERLGKHRELEMLRRVVDELKVGARRGDGEREIAKRYLKAMRIAFKAFEGRDGEKVQRIRNDLEHGIHARELLLEGKRGEEARRVVRTQPKPEHLIEILFYAARVLKKQDKDEQAGYVQRVAQEWLNGHRGKAQRGEKFMHALELAHESLAAAKDERNRKIRAMLGERMEQLRARREWNRDETGQVIEILHYCEDRLREQKKADAADLVHGVRERLHARWREQKPKADEGLAQRVERLERRVEKIAGLLERLVEELEQER
ncbi:MAG: hypothetical protein ACYS0E_09255 [Planctomycetota bacterium]|jgi:hypothetical protein